MKDRKTTIIGIATCVLVLLLLALVQLGAASFQEIEQVMLTVLAIGAGALGIAARDSHPPFPPAAPTA